MLSDAHLHRLYHQLQSATTSGIPLPDLLNRMSRFERNARLAKTYRTIAEEVQTGSTLVRSFGNSHLLPREDLAVLEAAERTGSLDIVLGVLAEESQQRQRRTRDLMVALAYPVFLICAAILILPIQDLVLNGATSYLRQIWPILIVVAMVALFLARRSIADVAPIVPRTASSVFFRVPYLGGLFRNLVWERYCTTLSLTLGAGLPLFDALRLAATTLGTNLLAKEAHGVEERVYREGTSLSEALERETTMPRFVQDLIHAGEMSGTLDRSLKKAAVLLAEQTRNGFRAATAAGGVMVYLGVALYIASRIIGFYQGYFEQIDQFTR